MELQTFAFFDFAFNACNKLSINNNLMQALRG